MGWNCFRSSKLLFCGFFSIQVPLFYWFLARNTTWSDQGLWQSWLSWHFQPIQKCRKYPKKTCFYRLPEGLHMSDMLIQTKPSLPEIHPSLTLMLFSMSAWVVWDFWQSGSSKDLFTAVLEWMLVCLLRFMPKEYFIISNIFQPICSFHDFHLL